MALSVREARLRRHKRVRGRVRGTAERPRLVVTRSNRGIVAQVVNDAEGKTLASASWLQVKETAAGDKKAQAAEVGRLLARNARKENIESVVFDRAGFKYHGRIRSLADGARESGLDF